MLFYRFYINTVPMKLMCYIPHTNHLPLYLTCKHAFKQKLKSKSSLLVKLIFCTSVFQIVQLRATNYKCSSKNQHEYRIYPKTKRILFINCRRNTLQLKRCAFHLHTKQLVLSTVSISNYL